MKREQFVHELTVGYKYMYSIVKKHLYRLVDGEVVEAVGYTLIETEGGAKYLVKWGSAGSKQHKWCCLNEAATRLCKDLAKLDEEVKPCGLLTFNEAKEKLRASKTVEQAVKEQPAAAAAK